MKPVLTCIGCSRRSLLKGLGLIALAPLALDALTACQGGGAPTATATTCAGGMCVDLTDTINAPLTMIGGAMLVDTSGEPLIVIRTSQTAVVALSAICTHAGCTVDYDASAQSVNCPCHGSVFSQSGAVLNGPAQSPLRMYAATLASDQITITL